MFTQCPECGTVFRVTAPVLKAAQGQVRCGVCDAAFDALKYLSDDVEVDADAAPASRISVDVSAAPRPAVGEAPHKAGEAAPAPDEIPRGPREAARAPGGATRNRPSADEERELGEIAAALARSQAPRAPEPPADSNVLEPGDIEDFILEDEAAEPIPDSALEFDAPAESWDQVFVRDRATASATPLDLNLDIPPPEQESAEPQHEFVLVEDGDSLLERTDEFPVPDFAAAVELETAGGVEIELEPAALDELASPAAAPAPPVHAVPDEPAAPVATEALVEAPHAAEPDRAETRDAGIRAARALRPLEPAESFESQRAAPDSAHTWLTTAAGAAAAVALGLVLIAQVIHQYRDNLAESPVLGTALSALYARIGLPLEPHVDLAAFDVRQWGAQTEEAAGVLRLRASIVNRATKAQPYPLLRVTLEDRFGSKVGRREFTPAEYLPGRSAPHALLGPGARADADLNLADPGNQAVGFELDVCVLRRGELTCGIDAKQGGS